VKKRTIIASVVGAFLTLSSIGGVARAQTLPDATHEDLPTLEKNLADETSKLTTSDCATACRALASIRRAAEKICALDPDDRCVAARAKAQDAARRVREACPDCAIASAPIPGPHNEERAMGKGATPKPALASEPSAAPPPSEARRGGCAGCTTTDVKSGDGWMMAAAIGAVAALLRRKRRS
jgi:MYXO-CTERM domain-containing protein